MSSMIGRALSGAVSTILPERRIYVQTSEGVRRLRLGPVAQLGCLVLGAGALAGAGAAGATLVPATGGVLASAAHDTPGAYAAPLSFSEAVNPQLEQLRTGYETRLAQMTAEQLRLEVELQTARRRHEEAATELKRKERALDEASNELTIAAQELSRLRTASGRHDDVELGSTEALTTAQGELGRLRFELAEAKQSKDGLARTLDTFAQTMEQVIVERDDATAKAETLDEKIATISEEQTQLLDTLEEAAKVSLGGMKEMFERSGLDLDRILDETAEDYTGSGGPFEALAEQVDGRDGQTEIRVAALMDSFEQVNLMRFAARRLPFGVPVTGVRMTSNFGPRSDPLGRGRALHKGVDFAGPRGTPILATADGVVSFAGRQRGYGNIVIISHPFGIETRYAHLNRLHVKTGQRVERGDRIADMGNTGRSTGNHLHYEVRIDAEAVNPADFLQASRRG